MTSTWSSGGACRSVTVLGKDAQLKFTGLGVLYVAPKFSTGGYMNVFIDGKLLGEFTNDSASTALGQIIARTGWTTSGAHIIKVVDAPTGKRIALDAFVIIR